jgi:hypothetical protein
MIAACKAHSGASYYTRYRCKFTQDSAVGAASNAANLTKYNGYNGLFNNCLTKAVYILNIYWTGPLGLGWAIPPGNYFNALGKVAGGRIINF